MTVRSARTAICVVFLAMSLMLFGVAAEAATGGKKDAGIGSMSGRIMIKDSGPLSGGQVMFYNAASGPAPVPEKYERTPDIVRDLDQDGRFSAELPAGKYYLGAVRRASGERIGPPEEGDIVFRSVDDKGRPKEYVVQSGRTLDIGTMNEAAPLKAHTAAALGVTAIEGTVIDPAGNPVPDAVIVAFLTPTLQSKPIFVSDKTGKNGSYRLRVTAGTYYLRVRNMFSSGPPEPGQIVGYYGEGSPAPITIKDGEILKGIDFRVILFPGRGPFSGTAPGAR